AIDVVEPCPVAAHEEQRNRRAGIAHVAADAAGQVPFRPFIEGDRLVVSAHGEAPVSNAARPRTNACRPALQLQHAGKSRTMSTSPATENGMAQQLSNQRIAWFNGNFVPEGQVMIPFRDRSWKYGDGAFDMTRTFEGKPFRLKEHIDRFYRSLRYLQIDPGIRPREMIDHSEEVVARNEHLRPAVGDWWVGQRVSRGVDAVGDEGWDHTGPNVVIEGTPLPLAKRTHLYRDGAEV